jgi:hypothetical protein
MEKGLSVSSVRPNASIHTTLHFLYNSYSCNHSRTRPMHPIQKPQRPKINPRLLMMQIMTPRQNTKNIIPTMRNHRLQRRRSPKQPTSQDMATKYLRRQPKRQDRGNQVFEWMSILSRQCDGGFELMVLVVDALVEGFEV